MNITSSLTAFVCSKYDEAKAAGTDDKYGSAKMHVQVAMAEAIGAVKFAAMLCHENGCSDEATQILATWNKTWSEWFEDRFKECQ